MSLATCVVLRHHGGRTSEVCELAMQHNKTVMTVGWIEGIVNGSCPCAHEVESLPQEHVMAIDHLCLLKRDVLPTHTL